MTSSLVGSEMCIRDRQITVKWTFYDLPEDLLYKLYCCRRAADAAEYSYCLLYTSDAADDM
eukprot:8291849-Prorocentrum_lima.AAC.1